MSSEVQKLQWFGKKYWKTEIRIPIEEANDEKFVEHLKKELLVRCVKEYVENTEDTFQFRVYTNRAEPFATISVEMEDLFKLRERNRSLQKEILELVDKYKLLANQTVDKRW